MEQLNKYIEQARLHDYTEDQIRQSLIGAGWKIEQINAALRGLPAAQPTMAPALPQDMGSQDPRLVLFESDAVPVSQSANLIGQSLFMRKSIKLPLIIFTSTLLIIGSIYAYSNRKTSYQSVVQSFITAMQKNDKTKADSLFSSAGKLEIKKSAGTTSFYDVCNNVGEICTSIFKAANIAKSTKSYKDYKAYNGTKGKQIIYTLKQSPSSAKATSQTSSSYNTLRLSIAVVPKDNSWLIDYIDEGVDANVDLSSSTATRQ